LKLGQIITGRFLLFWSFTPGMGWDSTLTFPTTISFHIAYASYSLVNKKMKQDEHCLLEQKEPSSRQYFKHCACPAHF
jgi:hypothetical protein